MVSLVIHVGYEGSDIAKKKEEKNHFYVYMHVFTSFC